MEHSGCKRKLSFQSRFWLTESSISFYDEYIRKEELESFSLKSCFIKHDYNFHAIFVITYKYNYNYRDL